MPRYRLAVLGGTFDHLHLGHQALLTTAFGVGGEVAVGLTTDRFVARSPKPEAARVQPFSVRRAQLTRWIRKNFPSRAWRVVALEDPFGRSLEADVDALVVSQETLPGGRAVNRERRRLGRSPLPLVVVPLVLADDLEPISSRRIRAGVIASDGTRRSAIRASIVGANSADRRATERALRRAFPKVRVARPGSSGPSKSTGLTVTVHRRPGGWAVIEQSPRVRLRPRFVKGRRPTDLERGVAALLRPRDERKLFGTLGTSRR